jgi:hypothetical protein
MGKIRKGTKISKHNLLNICWFIEKEINQHLIIKLIFVILEQLKRNTLIHLYDLFLKCQRPKRNFDKLQHVFNNPKP